MQKATESQEGGGRELRLEQFRTNHDNKHHEMNTDQLNIDTP